MHPHCCPDTYDKSERELQLIQSRSYTCPVCAELLNKQRKTLMRHMPNPMMQGQQSFYGHDDDMGYSYSQGRPGQLIFNVDGTLQKGRMQHQDPIRAARTAARRAVLAQAYSNSDQIMFTNHSYSGTRPPPVLQMSAAARQHFEDDGMGYGGHGGPGDVGSTAYNNSSSSVGGMASNQGYGGSSSGQSRKPLAVDKEKAVAIAPASPRIADAFLKSLGFISATATASAPNSLLSQFGASESGTKLNSVTDLFPPLAVWLTNIAVQVPAVYGKAPEHFVSLHVD